MCLGIKAVSLIPLQIKLWAAGIAFGLALVIAAVCYFSGVSQGEKNITALWETDKRQQLDAILLLKGKIGQRESDHRRQSDFVANELRQSETNYEKAVAALNAERAKRLRISAERAEIYKRLAEAGPDQSGRLAGYAAELDRSLEEGRSLVGELKETLGQREAGLRLLGTQIKNDRKVLDPE